VIFKRTPRAYNKERQKPKEGKGVVFLEKETGETKRKGKTSTNERPGGMDDSLKTVFDNRVRVDRMREKRTLLENLEK